MSASRQAWGDMREIDEGGLRARLYEPPIRSNRPGVVVFDGAGGGFPADEPAWQALAEEGCPTLAVAYFRDGFGQPRQLPATLSRIPLEYALRSLEWLRHSPENPSSRVVVVGQSRGAELALLLGVRCPFLSGVAAFSPSDAVWQSQTYGGEPTAAWTEDGRGLPYRRFARMPGQWPAEAALSEAYVAGVPDAVIPAERIECPVLLASSRADRIWPSARMADAVAARRQSAGRPVENLQFDDASHLLMGFGDAPIRVSRGAFTMELGGTEVGTRVARYAGWTALLQFLAQV